MFLFLYLLEITEGDRRALSAHAGDPLGRLRGAPWGPLLAEVLTSISLYVLLVLAQIELKCSENNQVHIWY